MSRDGGPRVMGLNFASALMLNIGELISSVPKFMAAQRSQFSHLKKPNWLLRRWPEWTLLATGVVGGAIYAKKAGINKQTIVESSSKFKVSVENFIVEHVTEPLTTLFREIFFDDYGDVTDPEEIEASKQILVSALRDYHTTRALADKQGFIGSLTAFGKADPSLLSSDIRAKIEADSTAMKMDTIVRTMETQIRDPKTNIITGDVIELMLLQALYMKKEIMVAMGKFDRLLKANQFNLETMALAPAIMAATAIYNCGHYVFKRLGSDALRVNTQFEMRMTLRDIEQIFNKVANHSNYSAKDGAELYRMEPADLGLLSLLLHRFDELLHIHFYLNNTDAEEQVRMEEDLEELMSEERSIMQRINVVHRLCRYFPSHFAETRVSERFFLY